MFKVLKSSTGKRSFMLFNKVIFKFHRYIWIDFYKGNSGYYIDLPFVDIKIKKTYHGHSIW